MTAKAIDDDAHDDVSLSRATQRGGDPLARGVVGENIGLEMNFRLRAIDRGFQRREKVRTVFKQGNRITGDVARRSQNVLRPADVGRQCRMIG